MRHASTPVGDHASCTLHNCGRCDVIGGAESRHDRSSRVRGAGLEASSVRTRTAVRSAQHGWAAGPWQQAVVVSARNSVASVTFHATVLSQRGVLGAIMRSSFRVVETSDHVQDERRMTLADLILDRTRTAVIRASARARASRAQVLRNELSPRAEWTVLDLGASDGRHIHSILPECRKVTLADVDAETASKGAAAYGYAFVPLLDEGRLPFRDQEFDLVFCSSVLEHVTGPKAAVWTESSTTAFAGMADQHQMEFASEIRRIGRRYFVQTPYRYFPVDSHTWLPFPVALLPRPALLRLLTVTNRCWIKRTAPDWHLLSRRRVAELFPDGRIFTELCCGLPKSLIAIG
jgi:hypothetical protein